MPIPAGDSCENCEYADFAGPLRFYGREMTIDGVQIAYCRRAVPRSAVVWMHAYPLERTSYVLGVEWPEVRADDWCAEHSPLRTTASAARAAKPATERRPRVDTTATPRA